MGHWRGARSGCGRGVRGCFVVVNVTMIVKERWIVEAEGEERGRTQE